MAMKSSSNAASNNSQLSGPTRLCWHDASGEVRAEALLPGATTVGGGPRCQVRLPGDEVSPLHCVIHRDQKGVTVRRWSAAATLNDHPFTAEPLKVGDRLFIAGVEFWVDDEPIAGITNGWSVESTETDIKAERLRAGLQSARQRMRLLLATLRNERSSAEQAAVEVETAIAKNQDLTVNLQQVAEELQSCGDELQSCSDELMAVKTELASTQSERDEQHNLYLLAKQEIEELEALVADLRGDHATLLDEQMQWDNLREELVNKVTTLEQQGVDQEQQAVDQEQQAVDLEQQGVDLEQQRVELEQQRAELEQQKADVEQQKVDVEQQKVDLEQQVAGDIPTASTPATPESPVADSMPESEAQDLWSEVSTAEANETSQGEQAAWEEASTTDANEQATKDWIASFSSQNENSTPVSISDLAAEAEDPVDPSETELAETSASDGSQDTDDTALEEQGIDSKLVTESTVSPTDPTDFIHDKQDEPAEPSLPMNNAGQPPSPEPTPGQPSEQVATPESVDDLIPEDQPSSNAPVSFIEKYASMLPPDDEEDSLTPAEELPIAAPVEQVQEPIAEGDDESIEDYMAKLMQRMRGEAPAETASTPAPAPASDPMPAAPMPVAPMTSQSMEIASTTSVAPAQEMVEAPFKSLDELRSGSAPQQATDLSSLRALANQSARHAVGVSEVRQDRDEARVHLTIGIIAMACAALLATTAQDWTTWTVFAGGLGFLWGSWWFFNTMKLTLEARAKEEQTKVREYDDLNAAADKREEFPIAPSE